MTAESREQEPHDDHRALERTPGQRMEALSKADEVRVLRAQLKRDLKAGRVSPAALMVLLNGTLVRHGRGLVVTSSVGVAGASGGV